MGWLGGRACDTMCRLAGTASCVLDPQPNPLPDLAIVSPAKLHPHQASVNLHPHQAKVRLQAVMTGHEII